MTVESVMGLNLAKAGGAGPAAAEKIGLAVLPVPAPLPPG